MAAVHDYGFYTIDINYVKYLYSIDNEVYYDFTYKNNCKPFVGIITLISDINYFIPLSSVKEKHKFFRNISIEHLLIHEIVDIDEQIQGAIYKPHSNNKKKRLISILDIKKMIPVPSGLYKKIIFNEIEDVSLLTKYRQESENLIE